MNQKVALAISPTNAGLRIDKFLAQALGLSRREVLLLLEHKCITLNSHTLTLKAKGQVLAANDQLHVSDYSSILSTKILANPSLTLAILAEGKNYLVVNKTAGMPVMPLNAVESDTVLNAVVAHYPKLQGVGQSGNEGGLRSGVVHRLDTDTSGTLIIATEESQWQALRQAFKNHKTTKRYRALVHGKLKGSGNEQMNLVIAQHKPAKIRVVTRAEQSNSSERTCDLSWRSIETFKHASLLEIELGTGFMHQIRVMFAHMGHPVIGDSLYGTPDTKLPKKLQANRQMLHAAYLKVLDIEATSPDPEDFSKLLEALRKDA